MVVVADYKGMVVIDTPTGTGSQHVENQTRELADRVPAVNYALAGNPDADYDGAATYSGGSGIKFYVGSMIHNTTASPIKVWRCVDNSTGAAVWLELKTANVLLELDDTPSSFTGEANKVLAVNAGETAVEFIDPLTLDTNAITLQGRTLASTAPSVGQSLIWNNGASRWEPGTPTVTGTLLGLTDVTDASYVGHNGHILRVNAGLTGMELIDGTTIFATASHVHTIANVTNLQTSLDAKLNLAGGTMTGNIAMGDNAITGLASLSLDAGQFFIHPTDALTDGYWMTQNPGGTSKFFQQNQRYLHVMGAYMWFYAAPETPGVAIAGSPTMKLDAPAGAIQWPDSSIQIRASGGQLVFNDPVAGTVTLAGLSGGATIDSIVGLRTILNEDHVLSRQKVEDRDLTTPPVSPANLTTYLIPSSGATGVWAGQDDNIAYYYGSTWQFIGPEEGMRLWVADENVFIIYDGTKWLELPIPNAIGVAA